MKTFNKPFLVILVVMLISGITGCSQDKKSDVYTIGICQFNSNPLLDATREGFIASLENTDFINRKNIKLNLKNAQGDIATTQLIIQSFVQSKVDLICAISTPVLQASINTTEEIPIVFEAIANPYRVGAGKDSIHHRKNVTGASSPSPIKKGMELVLEVLPKATRIGTLWNPNEENSHFDIERARIYAKELGLELIDVPVSSSNEVLMSAQVLSGKKIDAFFQILDNIVCSSFGSVVKVADEKDIPLFTLDTKYTEEGAFAAIGWDYFDNGYMTGELALRVMNGENPEKIPFQTLEKIKLYFNLKAGKKQNVILPDHLRNKANMIIEYE
ncbi:MAG: ABC transporter substrate-binding protein [Candidatus Cloacimonetes bacterium]|nr:ABC transporter substrate-binding protein [Candidatus Cloacimonadota bacterium]